MKMGKDEIFFLRLCWFWIPKYEKKPVLFKSDNCDWDSTRSQIQLEFISFCSNLSSW